MIKLKKTFVILAVVGLMIPFFAFAQYGLEEAAGGTDLIQNADTNAIPNLIGSIVGVALSFLGAIFFLLILYAGFLWMTAFGSSEKADKAKSILEHAAVGLIIVLAAYAISRFVFTSLKVGEGSSGGSSQTAGQPCGDKDNRVWDNNGTCITKCEYQYPVTNGEGLCMKKSSCEDTADTTVIMGLCPGLANLGPDTIVCCK